MAIRFGARLRYSVHVANDVAQAELRPCCYNWWKFGAPHGGGAMLFDLRGMATRLPVSQHFQRMFKGMREGSCSADGYCHARAAER
jgi:hypothetical protein